MIGRIIRGALVGTVLGIFLGVSLSGAMYMFNYMKQGLAEEKALIVEGQDEAYMPALSTGQMGKNTYDYKKLTSTLDVEGITGFAKEVAVSNLDTESVTMVAKEGSRMSSVENSPEENSEEKDTLGDSLLRFHVRANSNSQVDIALKYQVRDAVIEGIGTGLSECNSLEDAKDYIAENIELVEEIALNELQSNGYNYAVKVYLTNDYFPMRQYGDMVLPAGNYEALRIDIGLANGENFWCLLYPTLCVPVEAGGVITKEGQETLEENLTPEQYDKLFVKQQVPKENIQIRFKLWDMIFGDN